MPEEKDDEIVIDLKKLWQILWEKKFICFLIILVCAAGGWGTSFFRAKVPVQYQSVMLVRNQFNKGAIDNLLKDEIFINAVSVDENGAAISDEFADMVLTAKDYSSKAAWNGVQVTANAGTPAEAQRKLKGLKRHLELSYRKNIYAVYGKNTKRDYEKALEDLKRYCDAHNYLGMVYEIDFLMSGDEELVRLYVEFCDKKSAYNSVKNKLKNFYIDEPTLPDKPLPVKKRPPYALALAGAAVGVVISVLYAFWIYKKRFGFK